ncbi:MAG: transcriptional regulator [Lentisphaerae bacterium GWF2_52_8]|nr:MAG: transcriptional regulator [Lentisphaerae bacterium GWF2_52_8]
MKLNEFFSKNEVFSISDLNACLAENGALNKTTRNSILSYHRRRGRIISVRRGVYATVQPGMSPESVPVDPYLLAGRMTEDAVLAYHTALGFYGKAYSVFNRFHYLSSHQSQVVKFRDYEFHSVLSPAVLHAKGKEMFDVLEYRRSGCVIKATSLERTLVDVLDRPELTGSWEEIMRSLESVEFFDLDRVLEYVALLDHATTAAKVGFFLERRREELMVEERHLGTLRKLRPKQPHYLDWTRRRKGQLQKCWNLIVPDEILNKSWGEVL